MQIWRKVSSDFGCVPSRGCDSQRQSYKEFVFTAPCVRTVVDWCHVHEMDVFHFDILGVYVAKKQHIQTYYCTVQASGQQVMTILPKGGP